MTPPLNQTLVDFPRSSLSQHRCLVCSFGTAKPLRQCPVCGYQGRWLLATRDVEVQIERSDLDLLIDTAKRWCDRLADPEKKKVLDRVIWRIEEQLTLQTSGAVVICANWDELRLLSIWAERCCYFEERNPVSINIIALKLQSQYPALPPLTRSQILGVNWHSSLASCSEHENDSTYSKTG